MTKLPAIATFVIILTTFLTIGLAWYSAGLYVGLALLLMELQVLLALSATGRIMLSLPRLPPGLSDGESPESLVARRPPATR